MRRGEANAGARKYSESSALMRQRAKNFARLVLSRNLRNWLRAPGRSTRWIVDELRHRAGFVSTVEMRPGWRLRAHPAAIHFSYSAQLLDPEQVLEFDQFLSCTRPGMTLFDIGAHFGLFSLAACHYGGKGALAVAVDPSPVATRMISIQARLNSVSEQIMIIEASVSLDFAEHLMVSTGVLGAGYFLPPGDHSDAELTSTRAVTLDSLTEKAGRPPTHVKIDVEGEEQSVLAGASETLGGPGAPILFMELHNRMIRERGGDPSLTLSTVRAWGYVIYLCDGREADDGMLLSLDLVRVMCLKTAVSVVAA